MTARPPHDVVALLCAKFPDTFFCVGPRRAPLARGIHRELGAVLDGVVSRKLLHRALSFYTRDGDYLKALTAGAARINLDGDPSGHVTEAEAEFARAVLAECAAKQRKMRQPQRDGLAALRVAAQKRRAAGGPA